MLTHDTDALKLEVARHAANDGALLAFGEYFNVKTRRTNGGDGYQSSRELGRSGDAGGAPAGGRGNDLDDSIPFAAQVL